MSQPQRLPGAGTITLRAGVVDDALCAGNSVDRRMNQRTELVDQFVLEECAIDPAAAFEQQFSGAESSGQLFHRK
jgi:hypothetical protein